MRILPLVTYIHSKPISDRYRITREVSSITHAHVRSIISCFYYLEFARGIINGQEKFDIYRQLQSVIPNHLHSISINRDEIRIYDRLLVDKIYDLQDDEIYSTGYVVHTLEASIWCLLNSDSYEQATLKAVNLGSDTDTTGAVTGGLAGLLYGWKTIPADWLKCLVRKKDIDDLANRFEAFANR